MPDARPEFIKHRTELEGSNPFIYPGDTEPMAADASCGRKLGLTRLGIHHARLAPGQRTSYPHAESLEEESVFVLKGEPDVWVDGALHRLRPGNAVGFQSGTGICHTFFNNTVHEVRLLVVGEADKPANRIRYPLNEAYEATRPDRWLDWPGRSLAWHDGKARAPDISAVIW